MLLCLLLSLRASLSLAFAPLHIRPATPSSIDEGMSSQAQKKQQPPAAKTAGAKGKASAAEPTAPAAAAATAAAASSTSASSSGASLATKRVKTDEHAPPVAAAPDPAAASFAAAVQRLYDESGEKATLTAWLIARGYPAEQLGVFNKRQLLAMYKQSEDLVDDYTPRTLCNTWMPPERTALLQAAMDAGMKSALSPSEKNVKAQKVAEAAVKQWELDNNIPQKLQYLPPPESLKIKLEQAMNAAFATRVSSAVPSIASSSAAAASPTED